MNQQEFDKILERRLAITRDVLTAKGKEYKEVGKRDRLHNFNRGAEMEKTTRERYLRSLWLKNLVLLFDIIDDWQEEKVTTEIIDEKIGDSINYLILLEAMLKEDVNAMRDKWKQSPAGTIEYCGACNEMFTIADSYQIPPKRGYCSICERGITILLRGAEIEKKSGWKADLVERKVFMKEQPGRDVKDIIETANAKFKPLAIPGEEVNNRLDPTYDLARKKW